MKIVNSKGQSIKIENVSDQSDGTILNVLENGLYFIELSNEKNQVWRGKITII